MREVEKQGQVRVRVMVKARYVVGVRVSVRETEFWVHRGCGDAALLCARTRSDMSAGATCVHMPVTCDVRACASDVRRVRTRELWSARACV